MKFGEYLLENICSDWSKHYINYEELKNFLYASTEGIPSNVAEPHSISDFHTELHNKFFNVCENELNKVNLFYSEKLAEAKRRFAELRLELRPFCQENGNTIVVGPSYVEDTYSGKENAAKQSYQKCLSKKNIKKIQLSFYDFYLSLVILQNYQNLNFLGFQKILRKYNKLLIIDSGTRWFKERVVPSHFHTSKETKHLIQETEDIIAVTFEGGDRQKTQKKLRSHPAQDHQSFATIFRVGLYSGCLFILLIAALISAFFYHGGEDWHIILRIYRGPLVIVELVFFAGVNIHIWQKAGINHIRIFDLDPKDHLNTYDVLEIACLLGIVWVMSVLGFLHSSYLYIPPYVFPLGMLVLVLIVLLNPLPIFWYKARLGMLKIIGRTFISPTFRVYLADYWLADQMISLWFALMDLHFYFCFYLTRTIWTTAGDTSQCLEHSYISRSIAASIPAAIRFVQCMRLYRDTKLPFPHLANAGKYSTVLFVFTFLALFKVTESEYLSNTENPYFITWVFFSTLNAVWAYLWDVMVDWGLFDKFTGKNMFLKDEMIFPNKGYYYFIIIEDFVLRYNWLCLYLMTNAGYASLDLMFTILSPLEVFRRFLWNIFRLENEHIRNRDKYQSLRSISLSCHDDPDQKVNIKMSDEESSKCRRRKSVKREDTNNTTPNAGASSFKMGIRQILSLKLTKGSYKPDEQNRRRSDPKELFVVSSWPEYK